MIFTYYLDLQNFATAEQIDKELYIQRKIIIELKLQNLEKTPRGQKKSINKDAHLIKHAKRQISQLLYKRSCLTKIKL
jgi:hypothetical protein